MISRSHIAIDVCEPVGFVKAMKGLQLCIEDHAQLQQMVVDAMPGRIAAAIIPSLTMCQAC